MPRPISIEAIEESGAVVTHDPLPIVDGDQVQLTQLFQNLLANAIKFRSQEPPRIHVSAQAQEGDWLLSVQDNGIGIAPEHQERIFAIFQRLHAAANIPAPASAWPSARRSWNATAAASGWNRSRAREPPFISTFQERGEMTGKQESLQAD